MLQPIRTSMILSATSSLVVSLGGCGPSANTSQPATAATPAVIITLDGAQHACLVALYSEPQGSTVPCAEVPAFVRDELRVARGSTYDIRTTAQVDDAERAAVEAGLKAAGYRVIGAAD
jgi:hypothetical protein